jgi:HEAT repeat protein
MPAARLTRQGDPRLILTRGKEFSRHGTLGENVMKPQDMRSRLLAAAMGAFFFLGSVGCTGTLTKTRRVEQFSPMPVQAKIIIQDLPWNSMHLAIVNGDDEPRHKRNAATAAKAGLENKAAHIYIAGLSDEVKGPDMYDGTVSGVEAMLRDIGNASKKGETVFLYVTGHGRGQSFVLESHEKIGHRHLLKHMEKHLPGRNVIFISDACYSANFVNLVMDSKAFARVKAMSPGIQNESTCCDYFAGPFWHAVRTGLDLDRNNMPTLQEAFYYGLKSYRKYEPNTFGTYRETIPEVKSMAELRDGVLMVTADWCGACQLMKPVFNTAQMLLTGKTDFRLIDAENAGYRGSIPAILIIKDGKIVAKREGAMDFRSFSRWLGSNGVKVEGPQISLKSLYRQGRYESILRISGWEELKTEFGEKRSFDLLKKLFKSPDTETRYRALDTIVDGAKANKLPKDTLWKLSDSKDPDSKTLAAFALAFLSYTFNSGDIYHANTKIVPHLKPFLDDKDVNLRLLAGEALAMMAPKCFDPVTGDLPLFGYAKNLLWDGKPERRGTGAWIIANLADHKHFRIYYKGGTVERRLGQLLEDRDHWVRLMAINAIINVAYEHDISRYDSIIRGLRRMYRDPDSKLRKEAATALLVFSQYDQRRYIKDMASFMGDPDPSIRVRALSQFWYRLWKAYSARKEIADAYEKLLADPEEEIRKAAINLLDMGAISYTPERGVRYAIIILNVVDDPELKEIGMRLLFTALSYPSLKKKYYRMGLEKAASYLKPGNPHEVQENAFISLGLFMESKRARRRGAHILRRYARENPEVKSDIEQILGKR